MVLHWYSSSACTLIFNDVLTSISKINIHAWQYAAGNMRAIILTVCVALLTIFWSDSWNIWRVTGAKFSALAQPDIENTNLACPAQFLTNPGKTGNGSFVKPCRLNQPLYLSGSTCDDSCPTAQKCHCLLEKRNYPGNCIHSEIYVNEFPWKKELDVLLCQLTTAACYPTTDTNADFPSLRKKSSEEEKKMLWQRIIAKSTSCISPKQKAQENEDTLC